MTYCRSLPQIQRTKPISFPHWPWRWSQPQDQSQNQVGEFSMITLADFPVAIMDFPTACFVTADLPNTPEHSWTGQSSDNTAHRADWMLLVIVYTFTL